jgi:hypothetical protein
MPSVTIRCVCRMRPAAVQRPIWPAASTFVELVSPPFRCVRGTCRRSGCRPPTARCGSSTCRRSSPTNRRFSPYSPAGHRCCRRG